MNSIYRKPLRKEKLTKPQFTYVTVRTCSFLFGSLLLCTVRSRTKSFYQKIWFVQFQALGFCQQTATLERNKSYSKTKTKPKTKNATHSFTGKQVTAHLFQNRIRKQTKRIRPTDTRNPNVEVILIVGVFWHFIPNSKVHLVV